ncbi:hypothetical protein BJ165DRAFT_1531896 [Panaeolus papilionaceus]|nr:hypothetical protein BJ165DRAFT_1531896 [Panaeolus papilionaceus]
MSIQTPSTTNPLFNMRLVSKIIDHLALCQSEEGYDQPTLHWLRSCSLVCKAWTHPCQRLIFSRIKIRDGASPQHPSLGCLTEIFHDNPTLLGYIQELSIVIDATSLVDFSTDGTLKPPQNPLLQFPNLVSLKISYAPNKRFIAFHPLPLLLVLTYIQQPSLRTIRLQHLTISPGSDTWTHMLKSLNLQRLSITRGDTPPHLDLSFSQNPQPFRHLSTSLDFLRVPDFPEVLISMLDDAQLRCFYTHTIKEVVDGLKSCPGLRIAVDAMRNIEVLDIVIRNAEDSEELHWLLEHLPCLKSLTIDASALPLNQTSILSVIRPICSENHIFYDVEYLTLNLLVDPEIADSYRWVMSDLSLLVYRLSSRQHKLKSISISLIMSHPTVPQRVVPPWKQIATTLASREHFPAMAHVGVSISLCVSGQEKKMEVLKEFGGDEELKTSLQRTMRVLDRPGMVLGGGLTITEA